MVKSKSSIPATEVSRKSKSKQREASLSRPVAAAVIGTGEAVVAGDKGSITDSSDPGQMSASGVTSRKSKDTKDGESRPHSKLAFLFGFGKKHKETRAKADTVSAAVKRHSFDEESLNPQKEQIEVLRRTALRSSEKPVALSTKLVRKRDSSSSRLARFLRPSHSAQISQIANAVPNGLGERPEKSCDQQKVTLTTARRIPEVSEAVSERPAIVSANDSPGNSNASASSPVSVVSAPVDVSPSAASISHHDKATECVDLVQNEPIPDVSDSLRRDVATQCDCEPVAQEVLKPRQLNWQQSGQPDLVRSTGRKSASLTDVTQNSDSRTRIHSHSQCCPPREDTNSVLLSEANSSTQQAVLRNGVDVGQRHRRVRMTLTFPFYDISKTTSNCGVEEGSKRDDHREQRTGDSADWIEVRREDFESMLSQMAELKQYALTLQTVLVQCGAQQ